jgi:hypothetical protein
MWKPRKKELSNTNCFLFVALDFKISRYAVQEPQYDTQMEYSDEEKRNQNFLIATAGVEERNMVHG